jgi:hypothetical protein
MKQFEYKQFTLRGTGLVQEMNHLGEQGWELMCLLSREDIPNADPYSPTKEQLLTFVAKREKTSST